MITWEKTDSHQALLIQWLRYLNVDIHELSPILNTLYL